MAYIEVNVDIDDLYDSLRTSDKERIIELLRDDDLLDEDDDCITPSIMEQYFIEDLNYLKGKYLSLSLEDIELLKTISKKY